MLCHRTSPLTESAGPGAAPPSTSWRDSLRVYLAPESLRMLSLGFAAGLPLLLVLGTLSFRLREAGVDRSTIGHLRESRRYVASKVNEVQVRSDCAELDPTSLGSGGNRGTRFHGAERRAN